MKTRLIFDHQLERGIVPGANTQDVQVRVTVKENGSMFFPHKPPTIEIDSVRDEAGLDRKHTLSPDEETEIKRRAIITLALWED